MATQAESPASNPSAQVVGNAFVEQYYQILHQSPELVYRFYQESSVLSRPDSDGVMTAVTTMEGINERIVSLNYKDYIAEIKTADAQQSLGNGVVVLVTGYLTGSDKLRRKFTQSFFLAPQEKGFYVLNDVFRYVEDEEPAVAADDPVNDINENVEIAAPQAPEPEQPSPITGHNGQLSHASNEGDLTNEAVVCDPSDNEDGSVIEEEIVEPPAQLNQSEIVTVTSEQSASPDDAPKKSYASILKVMKAASSTAPVRAAPVTNAKVKTPSSNQEAAAKAAPVSESWASTSETAPEKNDVPEEAEGHSIYVRNLPQNATAAQLEDVFAKFGPIKQGGVQVRSNKGFCFGFVEFESLSSMKSAIEASPITIGSRKAVIEEKRTTTRVSAGTTNNNGRGRYPSRGGFRSESFRGRGNFSGGRGYGRNDFRNHGEFSSKPRGGGGGGGGGGRGVEGYQRVDQNGTGNGGRQGGQK